MDTQPTNNGPLFKRIALVMAAVRNMPKDGVNTQSNFNYFSSDGILDRIGKEMAAQGLVIIPTLTEYESVDEPTSSGKTRTRTRAYFQMDICDVDGNAYSARWAGEGTDYGNPDRALNKAMTNATKYFLLKLFVVGQGGDADDDEAGEAPARRAAATKPAQPKPQPAQEKADAGLLQRFSEIGLELYGEANWPEVAHRNVSRISGGAADDAAQLTPEQIRKLISGMMKVKATRQPVAA